VDRRLVGGQAVRAGEDAERDVGDEDARRPEVAALVVPDLVAENEQPPVVAEGALDVVGLFPRVVGGHEVLRAVLDPLHGPAGRDCEVSDQEVLREEVAADAKAAS